MKLLHERDGDIRPLATTVETADSFLSQMRGLMFKRSLPEEYALVFRFDDVATRDVHMLFVFTPLDVLWLVDDAVVRKERLSPWTGFAAESADVLVELPPGGADTVEVGDRVKLVD